jgi:hypothetical protein
MPPVRVKVYGLFTMRRRTYLVVQTIGLIVVLTAIGLGFFWPRPTTALPLTPRQRLFLFLLDALPWLGLFVLVAEALETVIILRRFARKAAGT